MKKERNKTKEQTQIRHKNYKTSKTSNWLSKLIDKLRDFITKLYYREEEPEYTTPKNWKTGKTSFSSLPTSLTPKIKRVRIHVPILRSIKQIIAGILFFVNSLIGLAGLASANPGMGLIFLLNAFIFLDYLWKLSRWKIIREEEE